MSLKALRVLGVLVLVVGLTIVGRAQNRELTILHTNDTHSNLLPFPDGSGGIARMATLIRELKGANPNVLVLNAGDVFVGTFEFNKYLGYPELKFMEDLYDAMALGNHELDRGFDALAGVVSGQLAGGSPVTLPLLCANINLDGTPLASFIQPSIMKTVGGIKVGIFGLVNPDPQNYTAEVAGRLMASPFVVAAGQAASLRAQGCQVVIALSHLGTAYDLYGLADKVSGIDIIVGGHSHDVFTQAVVRNGIIVVQAGCFGRYLGELKVEVAENGGVTLGSWVLHQVDASVRRDREVNSQVNAMRDGVVRDPRFGPVYSQVVAKAVQQIAKPWPESSQNRDSALGNLVTDAIRVGVARAGFSVDLALDSYGYTSTGIPKGKVVGNDIMRAVPYGYDAKSGLGFKIVVAPLPGLLLLGGLEYAAGMVDLTTDLAIQASGLTYSYDSSKPRAGSFGQFSRLDVMTVLANGELVVQKQGKYYMVAMTEAVFNFLNNLVGGSLQSTNTGLFEYDLVRDHLTRLKTVNYSSQGRIKDVAPAAAPAAKK